jgi:hypothetical protein
VTVQVQVEADPTTATTDRATGAAAMGSTVPAAAAIRGIS